MTTIGLAIKFVTSYGKTPTNFLANPINTVPDTRLNPLGNREKFVKKDNIRSTDKIRI